MLRFPSSVALSSGNMGNVGRVQLMLFPFQAGPRDPLGFTDHPGMQDLPAPMTDIETYVTGLKIRLGFMATGVVNALHRNPSPRSGWAGPPFGGWRPSS